MTDHSALIERLDLIVAELEGLPHVKQTVAEAAEALRDQQAALEKWKRLKGYADDQVRVERAAYRSLLTDHEEHFPSAPNQAKEAGE